MNYFSSGLNVILSIIFVPIYLNYLGAEGYGLIGVFASLQGILSVLDAGLGGALSREIAADDSGGLDGIGSQDPGRHQDFLSSCTRDEAMDSSAALLTVRAA